MSNAENTIETLVTGGVLGAAIGALLSKDKEEGAVIGALLGAAFAATAKASDDAKKTNIPQLIEENGKLYELNALGEKRFIKELKKTTHQLPEQFKLS
ncbi:MAG: glycine zipper 2TM domain-containing protein [Chitinophagaceae bacterium]|jgi:hypothetical protein|nr:glycine zipper 2TM domain-containing protein [Chitinophagaceae bacterium]